MSVLDVNNNIIQTDRIIKLDKEKESIIKFLHQYTHQRDDIPIAPLSVADRSRHGHAQNCVWSYIDKADLNNPNSSADVPNDFVPQTCIHVEDIWCADVYLQLVDDQWVIVPFNYNHPVGVFDYFGDSFPDFIRFANGTSVCRIITSVTPTTNYGYRVPAEPGD